MSFPIPALFLGPPQFARTTSAATGYRWGPVWGKSLGPKCDLRNAVRAPALVVGNLKLSSLAPADAIEGGSMKWEGILLAIPLFLVVSFAQNTRVETKDVQPVVRFEQVISGHIADLNGKYKFRVSEVTYQPGGYVGDHNHAGPGVRVIMAGEFTYVKGDKTTVYKAGDAFFEPGDVTHRAYNRGSTILKVMNIEILPADFTGSALIPPQH